MGELGKAFLQAFGFPVNVISEAYYDSPGVALTLQVEEIFNQTPRKGTGNPIEKA